MLNWIVVLVGDVKLLKAGRRIGSLEYIAEEGIERLRKEVKTVFQSRYDCEDDLLLRQFCLIFYYLVRMKLFSYVRSKILKNTEKKVIWKAFCWFGGHIIRGDGAEFISNCVQRK